jgi:hypothetical protein
MMDDRQPSGLVEAFELLRRFAPARIDNEP